MASILLDTCVWGGVLPVLIDSGHDVVWSGSWPKDPGDVEILSAAFSARRILVTLGEWFCFHHIRSPLRLFSPRAPRLRVSIPSFHGDF